MENFFKISLFSSSKFSPRIKVVWIRWFETSSIKPATYLGPAPIKSRVKRLCPFPEVKQSKTNKSIIYPLKN